MRQEGQGTSEGWQVSEKPADDSGANTERSLCGSPGLAGQGYRQGVTHASAAHTLHILMCSETCISTAKDSSRMARPGDHLMEWSLLRVSAAARMLSSVRPCG